MDRIRKNGLIHWLQNKFSRTAQLQLLDYILCLFVVTPLAVGYYKGCFFIMEHHLFPGDLVRKLCTIGMFGYGTIVAVFMCQDLLHPLSESHGEPAFYFVSRLYNLILGLANVSVWYFIWTVSHAFIADSLGGVLRVIAVCTMALILARCYPGVGLIPPFVLSPMEYHNFFQASTRFRCKPKKSWLKFTLDVSFSVFVINSLIVMIWKNTWTFLDLTLYPDSFQSTTVASLIIGIFQTIAAYALQNTAFTVVTRLHSLPRIIFINCWLWFTGFTCIILWRGIWYSGDLFVRFENYGAVLPIVCLLFLQTFFSDNVLAFKGISDEHYFFPEKTRAVFYHIRYFQTLCEENLITEKPILEVSGATKTSNGTPETDV